MKVHTHFAFNFFIFYLLGLTPYHPLIFFATLLGAILPDIDHTDTQMVRFAKFWFIDKILFFLFLPFMVPLLLTDWFAARLQSTSVDEIIEKFKRGTDIFWAGLRRSPASTLKSLKAVFGRGSIPIGMEEEPKEQEKETQPKKEVKTPFIKIVGGVKWLWNIPCMTLRSLIFNLQPWESREGQYGRKEAFEKYVSKKIPYNLSYTKISKYIDDRWGHRTITHSFLFFLFLGLLIFPFTFIAPFLRLPLIVLLASLFLHFLLDINNVTGVYFFYPANVLCVFPALQEQRSRAGGFFDNVVFTVSLVLIIPLIVLSLYGGFYRNLHIAMKDSWCAIADYHSYSPTHRVIFQVTKGREVQTNRFIAGNLLAVGSPNNLSVIVEDKNHYKYLIGQPPWSTLTGGVVAYKDVPITTTTEELRLEDKKMSDLINLIKNKGDECRISGFMRLAYAADHLPIPNYPTIQRVGEFYEFTLADVYDIKRFGLADSFIIAAEIKLKITHYQSKDFKYPITAVERGESL